MQLVCSSFVFLINKHSIVFHQLERNKGVTEQSEMESIIYSKSCMYMLFFCPPTDTKSVIPVLKSRRKNTTSLSSLKDLFFSNSSSDFFPANLKWHICIPFFLFYLFLVLTMNHLLTNVGNAQSLRRPRHLLLSPWLSLGSYSRQRLCVFVHFGGSFNCWLHRKRQRELVVLTCGE